MAKRRIRQNVWGNWYGYVGTRRVAMFFDDSYGSQEDHANEWLTSTMEVADEEMKLRNAILDRIKLEKHIRKQWCTGCEVVLSSTDLKAKRCTQCGTPVRRTR